MKLGHKASKAKGPIQWTPAELWVRRGVYAFVLLLAALGLWFTFAEERERNTIVSGPQLQMPLADLKAGKLRLFNYAIDSTTLVQLAIQRGDDGILRVAIASCRSCQRFRHYKSFGKVICGHCGHTMKVPDPGAVPAEKKNCVPVALPYSIEGNQLVVRRETITEVFQHWYRPATSSRSSEPKKDPGSGRQ